MLKWKKFVCEECGHQFESNWLLRYCCPKCGHFAIAGRPTGIIIAFWVCVAAIIGVLALAALGYIPADL